MGTLWRLLPSDLQLVTQESCLKGCVEELFQAGVYVEFMAK